MEKLLGASIFQKVSKYLDRACEIRIRRDKPIYLLLGSESIKIDFIAKDQDLENILSVATNRSVYAVSEKLTNGFLPYGKGVRIGLCGEWVCEKGKLISIKNYSSLNIRISKEIRGCSSALDEKRLLNGNTLVISPPCGGKTTFLRDMIYRISLKGLNIAVIDERGELWSNGAYDLGDCTDVISGAGKSSAFFWAVRTLSPHFVAMDELLGQEDFDSVHRVVESGVNVVATIHGKNCQELKNNDKLRALMERFHNLVELSTLPKVGTVKRIFSV